MNVVKFCAVKVLLFWGRRLIFIRIFLVCCQIGVKCGVNAVAYV